MVITGGGRALFLTGGYELSPATAWKYAAAAADLLLAALALYAGMAFEREDSRLPTILPTLRRGTARKAIAGSPANELAGLHKEAGVRKQLRQP